MGFRMGYVRAVGSPRVGGPHQPLPLAVDLDGAVFRKSIARAVLNAGLRHNFRETVGILLQQKGNRAFAAWLLALRYPKMPVTLDLNPDIVDLVRLHHRFGTSVALVTGMRREIALGVRNVLDLPDSVTCLGAEGADTLSAERKARLLIGYYGAHRYAYAGSANPDAASAAARRCFMVGAGEDSKRLGNTQGAPVVAMSRSVNWRPLTIQAAQLVGKSDPVRDLTTSATVSMAIWDRESVLTPVVAAEPKADFKSRSAIKARRRQT